MHRLFVVKSPRRKYFCGKFKIWINLFVNEKSHKNTYCQLTDEMRCDIRAHKEVDAK